MRALVRSAGGGWLHLRGRRLEAGLRGDTPTLRPLHVIRCIPLASILQRIVAEDISLAWLRYLKFAIYVVGVSGGVRVWDLEKHITPRTDEAGIAVLNAERWVLEVYRTIIGTLQSVA